MSNPAPASAATATRASPARAPSLLAPFHGALPPAPDWFNKALAVEPERSFIEVQGARIELLAWGRRGRPGLMFLHGHAAHADLWRFIAPFFAEEFRIGALSWSGMGRSDWRPEYQMDFWVEELLQGAQALGLFDAAVKPIIVAHSAGVKPALITAQKHGDRLGGLVVVDGATPSFVPQRPQQKILDGHRTYPSLEEALTHFRFGPAQPCENVYAADRIARDSLKQVDGGWSWRFDRRLWAWMNSAEAWDALSDPHCPLAIIIGEKSYVTAGEAGESFHKQAPPGTPFIVVPEAYHHLMVDQPIAFVTALRTLIAGWTAPQDSSALTKGKIS